MLLKIAGTDEYLKALKYLERAVVKKEIKRDSDITTC